MKTLLFLLLLSLCAQGEEISAPIFVTKSIIGKTFKLAPKANCPMIVVDGVQDIILKDLYLDGNKDMQTTEFYTNGLRNNCITIKNSVNVLIENVVVCNARSGGIVIEKKSFGIIINGLNSYEHYFDGFCIYESEQCQLVNAHIHSNEAAGISLDWSANNNSFKNIKLERNKDLSIFMRDSNNNMFDTILFMHTGVYLNHRDNDINSGCFNNLFININMPPVFIGPHCKQNLFIPAKK